jgi:protein MpaA
MAIRFHCPACNQPLEVDDSDADQQVICYYCRAVIKTPGQTDARLETPAAKVAVAVQAETINVEDPATALHAERVAWAKRAMANPDGMARNSRHNAHGVDLNRNFEAANRVADKEGGPSALSEPEARVIQEIIQQHSPGRIVSIHQPLACIDYDGPGLNIANRMAQYCDLPVKKLGARPGSLGSYAGVTLGIPIITLEMLPTDSQSGPQTLWNRYGKALMAAIVYPNTVEQKYSQPQMDLSAQR